MSFDTMGSDRILSVAIETPGIYVVTDIWESAYGGYMWGTISVTCVLVIIEVVI